MDTRVITLSPPVCPFIASRLTYDSSRTCLHADHIWRRDVCQLRPGYFSAWQRPTQRRGCPFARGWEGKFSVENRVRFLELAFPTVDCSMWNYFHQRTHRMHVDCVGCVLREWELVETSWTSIGWDAYIVVVVVWQNNPKTSRDSQWGAMACARRERYATTVVRLVCLRYTAVIICRQPATEVSKVEMAILVELGAMLSLFMIVVSGVRVSHVTFARHLLERPLYFYRRIAVDRK